MSARTEGSRWTPRSATTNEGQRRGHGSRHQSLSAMSTNANDPLSSHRSMGRERPLPPVPRIAEEDECPVCHRELPSRSLPNSDAAREAHIMRCINEQISAHSSHYTRPGAYTSNSQPPVSSTYPSQNLLPQGSPPRSNLAEPLPSRNDTASDNMTGITSTPPNLPANLRHLTLGSPSSSLTTAQAPVANTPEARMAAREQAHAAVVLGHNRAGSGSESPARRTGMFPYKATEKDCIDDAECTICLEEFVVGVAMARLECLCRFHRQCIQDWFVGHPGRCPVHQHDGYGF